MKEIKKKRSLNTFTYMAATESVKKNPEIHNIKMKQLQWHMGKN